MTTLRVPVFARLDEYEGVWAIESRAAAAFLELASKTDLAAHVAEHLTARAPAVESTLERIAAANGKSIALVRAQGVLMKQQSSLGNSTSTVQLRKDLRTAANDPEVSAILFAVDSPGGSVAGTESLAAEIRAARQKKPVYGHIEDLAASAAYWAVSQCDKIFAANASTQVGDIGTYAVVRDVSEAAQKDGVKTLVFASGPLKGIGTPGVQVTEPQKAYLQQTVEASQRVFGDAVKRGRGLTAEQLATVSQGGVFLAGDAQARGLIDGVQSLDATLTYLAGLTTGAAMKAAATATVSLGSKGQAAMKTFEDYLSARGLAADALAETTVTALRGDWEALKAKAEPLPGDAGNGAGDNTAGVVATINANLAEQELKAYRQKHADESRRVAKINELCAKHPEIGAKAIEEAWEPLRAENEVLKASRPTGPYLNMGSSRSESLTSAVLSAAVCLTAGLPNPTKRFKDETLDLADKHCKGWGLRSLILHGARRNGWHGDSDSAFQAGNVEGLLRAAFSTVDVPNIFSNIAGKFVVTGFLAVEQVWRSIARIRTVNDFKPTTGIRVTGNNEYEELGDKGEIKHGKIGEAVFTNQAKTYAKMLSISYRDMRNDDLGFLDDANALLGRGAGLAVNKAFWGGFLNNGSFFTSGHGNYASGAGTALSPTSLATAEALFMAQVNEDLDPIDLAARYILNPPSLRVTAQELYQSTNWNTGGAATQSQIAEKNIWAGKYEPLTSRYLSNANLTGYSTTAWYLLADPADAATMEVVFLDGQQEPKIETAQADFHQLGIDMRGVLHFGVAQQEYRGGVKMAGV